MTERRYQYRTTRSGAVRRTQSDGTVLPHGRISVASVMVRCAWCRGLFEDVIGDTAPCPHCGATVRGAA